MNKNYKDITGRIKNGIGELRKHVPDVLAGFNAMSTAATKDGALNKKTKELIALALGVAAHCEGCIGFHTQALARLGATREEVSETLAMATYMGGGPSLMYAAEAILAFDEAVITQSAAT
jgi:AhpD family alkylhydroperoxidase